MERHNDKQERLRPFGGKWGDVYVQSDRAESESREREQREREQSESRARAESESRESESSVICQDKNK